MSHWLEYQTPLMVVMSSPIVEYGASVIGAKKREEHLVKMHGMKLDDYRDYRDSRGTVDWRIGVVNLPNPAQAQSAQEGAAQIAFRPIRRGILRTVRGMASTTIRASVPARSELGE